MTTAGIAPVHKLVKLKSFLFSQVSKPPVAGYLPRSSFASQVLFVDAKKHKLIHFAKTCDKKIHVNQQCFAAETVVPL